MLSVNVKQKIEKDFSERLSTLLSQMEGVAQSADLVEIERFLEQSFREMSRPILEQVVQAKADQTSFSCETCERPLALEKKQRPRTLTACSGKISFKRDSGRCSVCKQWSIPADRALGVEKGSSVSPLLSEKVALMVLKMPSAQVEEIALRTCGISLCASTLHQEALRQGKRAQKLIEKDALLTKTHAGVVELATRFSSTLKNPFTLIIQIDAFHIRERDDWGLTEKKRKKGEEISRWHWVYVATCFQLDHRAKSASGRPIITQRAYVATRLGLEAFEQQLYAQVLQQGLHNAEHVVVLADGAAWIWNIANNRYPYATHRLDLWHLKEHLWEIAHELYGAGSVQAKEWIKPLLHKIENKKEGIFDVISSLDQLKEKFVNKSKAIDKQIAYFQSHQSKMDYPNAKKREEPLGSGAIESTCKQYQGRFKRPGQFWSTSGDEALLSLETLFRNGQWNRLFPSPSSHCNN